MVPVMIVACDWWEIVFAKSIIIKWKIIIIIIIMIVACDWPVWTSREKLEHVCP